MYSYKHNVVRLQTVVAVIGLLLLAGCVTTISASPQPVTQTEEEREVGGQLLLLDFYLKDQASVHTFTDYIDQTHAVLADEGFQEIARYVEQDDPNHLVFLVQWPSREQHSAWMEETSSQPNASEMLGALFAGPPRSAWLDEIDTQ